MLNFLKNLFKETESGDLAKNRLKVVIMQDRSSLSPQIMEKMKKDLIAVFKKYVEIEENGIEVNIEKENHSMGLSISIPVKKLKAESSKSWN